jgi:two-component system phosphate regulon response regulator PhoB
MSLKPILIIADDDDDAREMLAALLAEHGYVTRPARDGRDALMLLGALDGAPAILLLDLLMPMSGFEVLDVLANLGRSRDVPVLVLSALAPPVDLPFGVDGYLPKPIDPDLLVRTIESLSRPYGASAPRRGDATPAVSRAHDVDTAHRAEPRNSVR